jgi:metal-sulfur cluster biosynthetic enzyme
MQGSTTTAAARAKATRENDVNAPMSPALRDTMHAFELFCTHNSQRLEADAADKLTPFHSVVEPPVAIDVYVHRLVRYLGCSDHGVMMGMILTAKYCVANALLPSRLTMHRLLLTTTLIAVKCHHDIFSSNQSFAKIGGIMVEELNALEVLVFHGLGFRTRIRPHDVKRLSAATAASRRTSCSLAASLSEPLLATLRRAFYPTEANVAAGRTPPPLLTRDKNLLDDVNDAVALDAPSPHSFGASSDGAVETEEMYSAHSSFVDSLC